MNEYVYNIDIDVKGRKLVSVKNFSIPAGKITFLFGESGIGKSLLSKAVYGLLDPTELKINLNGLPYTDYLKHKWTNSLKEKGFFVFQEPSSHLNPLEKISTQLSEGSLENCKNDEDIIRHLWKGVPTEEVRKILDVYPKPFRPSGGEKQRSLLAMAFKKLALLEGDQDRSAPRLFFFDEPTGSLDNNYRNLFLELLLKKYRETNFTGIIITHDYSIISEIQQKHPDLINHVCYKELLRVQNEHVKLVDFAPNDYTTWLRNVENSASTDSYGEEILRLGHEFSIFDRKLKVYSDIAHQRPTDLVIKRGEMVYVKAPSGMGKTTLAKIVMGLYKAQNMKMSLSGINVSHKDPETLWHKKIWGKKAGMIFQHADEALNLQATVKESFKGLPLKNLTDDVLRIRLSELFTQRHVEELFNKKAQFLSGGQKQRLNILRTIIMDLDLIILDEPLNGLDFESIKKVLEKIEEKQRQGTALLMISHNEEIFENIVKEDQIYYLGY